jgi:hypothetical protein
VTRRPISTLAAAVLMLVALGAGRAAAQEAAVAPPPPPAPPAVAPPVLLAATGKVRVEVERGGPSCRAQVETAGRVFDCGEVTPDHPCVLQGLPQGPALLRLSGGANVSKDLGVTDWPSHVRIDHSSYGPLFGGLLVAGLGVALMVGTDVGSVGYSAGAGFLAGGTTMVVWDIGRNHDLVTVDADGLASVRRDPQPPAPSLSWKFSF